MYQKVHTRNALSGFPKSVRLDIAEHEVSPAQLPLDGAHRAAKRGSSSARKPARSGGAARVQRLALHVATKLPNSGFQDRSQMTWCMR